MIVLANDECTFRGDREKLIVENRHGKEIIHVSLYVGDEGSMRQVSLQDLKGSPKSDVEFNIINLRENNDVYVKTE